MRQCLIISGGQLDPIFAADYLKNHTFDYVICADNGVAGAKALGLVPDLLVGDFDTARKELVEEYERKQEVKTIRLNPQKDETDTETAVSAALERGYKEIVLLGAMGNRFDHTLANLHMLLMMLKAGAKGYLLDDKNKIYLEESRFCLQKSELYGKYVSLVPFTPKVEGLTLKGFLYPLDNYCLEMGKSIGISNELLDEEGVITFDKGILTVIESHD